MSNLVKKECVFINNEQVFSTCFVKKANLPTEQKKTDPSVLAERIIAEAREKASKILADAQTKVDEIMNAASEKGFNQGYKKGCLEAKTEYSKGLTELSNFVEKLDKNTDILKKQLKSEAVETAIRISEKVINKKLSEDSDLFYKLYEKAVKDLNNPKWLKLTIDKSTVNFVTSNSDYLLGLVRGADRLEVEVLESAHPGTCIVETNERVVDSSVYTQIKLIDSVLVNAK